MKRFFFFVISFIFALFLNIEYVFADLVDSTPPAENDPVEEKINFSKEESVPMSDKSMEDIFGDEQTFPFVAGLGKNAAH